MGNKEESSKLLNFIIPLIGRKGIIVRVRRELLDSSKTPHSKDAPRRDPAPKCRTVLGLRGRRLGSQRRIGEPREILHARGAGRQWCFVRWPCLDNNLWHQRSVTIAAIPAFAAPPVGAATAAVVNWIVAITSTISIVSRHDELLSVCVGDFNGSNSLFRRTSVHRLLLGWISSQMILGG